jgi:RNA polymerase sigma-70 factor (ECF subfamily)
MNIESIWNEYRLSLHRFLSSKIDNHADVEDLLQIILIKTHKSLGSLKSEDRIKPWLFQIANRSIIDFYRKRATTRSIEPEDLWYEDYEENELLGCIEPFINALPDEQADLIRGIELQGQSQKEYAEQHNIPYSTLKSRVQKSRLALRKLFDQCCSLELHDSGRVQSCNVESTGCARC